MRLRIIVLGLMLACALQISAETFSVLGTAQYRDANSTKAYTMTVRLRQDGVVAIETHAYSYLLTQDEVSKLRKILADGLRLIKATSSNQTTVRYVSDVGGQFMTLTTGTITATFQTSSVSRGYLSLMFEAGGANLVLNLNEAQTSDLDAALGQATVHLGHVKDQLALFALD